MVFWLSSLSLSPQFILKIVWMRAWQWHFQLLYLNVWIYFIFPIHVWGGFSQVIYLAPFLKSLQLPHPSNRASLKLAFRNEEWLRVGKNLELLVEQQSTVTVFWNKVWQKYYDCVLETNPWLELAARNTFFLILAHRVGGWVGQLWKRIHFCEDLWTGLGRKQRMDFLYGRDRTEYVL